MRMYGLPRRSRLRRLLVTGSALLLIACLIAAARVAPWSQHNERFTIFRLNSTAGSPTRFAIGSFLHTLTPSNTSFCAFPFGRSENFSLPEELVMMSPELGDKGPYRVLYHAVTGSTFNSSSPAVTFATHATLEFMVHIAEIARAWNGPVSVACYLLGEDITPALIVLESLCYCEPSMSNVSIHIVYHTEFALNTSTVNNGSLSSCLVPKSLMETSVRVRLNLPYPVNVARNVARYGSRTEHFLVADIELFPSLNLAAGFLEMLQMWPKRRSGEHSFIKKKHVYVVPLFEVASDVRRLPRTKRELMSLMRRERAVYFHRYVCLHCQRFPGLQQWLQRRENPRSKPLLVQPLLVVKREFPHHRWEPVFIGTQKEPLYSELLTWDGQQDKMTQMYEMCLQDYRFVILDGAFLVHSPGIKHKKPVPKEPKGGNRTMVPATAATYKSEQMKRNSYLYTIITQDMMDKYPENPRCRRF